MAFSYQQKPDGNYEVFQDGNRVATGTQAVLANYGLALPAGAQSVATATPTKIPAPTRPPAYVSSTDVAGQFAADKQFIDQRTVPTITRPPGTPEDTTKVKPTGQQTTKTSAQEQGENLATYSDRLAAGQAKFDEKLQTETADANARLQSTLSTLGSQYDATKTSITAQYADLIKKTERLKALDVGRRNAYGLSSAVYDPIGHTDSVTQATDEWNANIARLNSERDSALQQAQIAYEQGKAGMLAASRKEITDIEDRIRQSTMDFQAKLSDQLKTANDTIKLKYQEFDERGKIAAQKALLQFEAYKAAKNPEERNKIIQEAIFAVGGDPNNAAEYAAVKDALDAKITANTKAEFEAQKNALDLEKTRTDIAHTRWQEHRTENQDYINDLIERAKLGDTDALTSLGISTGNSSNRVRLTNKEAITVQKDLSNDPNLQAINKAIDTWRALSAYEDQVKGTGANSFFSPIARGKAATKYQTAILNAKEYFNLGVLNGPDQAILQQVVPGVNTITPFAPFKATTALNGIGNLKTQFSDKLDNDFLAVTSRFSNYDEAQVPGLKDAKRRYIQTKAEINPQVKKLIEDNPDLSEDDIIQVINSRL